VVLAAVFSSTLGVGLIFGFQPPLLALVLARAGSSNFVIGAVTAASLVAVISLGPWYPKILARLGLRRSVIAGVCAGACLLAVMPLWPSVGAWLLLRLVAGGALGLSWIASEVWMNSVSGARSRSTVMGIYGTVFSIGIMAGPALLEFTGTRGWQPFSIGAAVLLASLLPLLLLRRVTSAAQSFTPMRRLGAAIRGAPAIMTAALVAGLVESADLTMLPLFGMRAGFPDRQALLLVTVFMAGNVVLQAPIGVLADRNGRRLMLAICALLSGVGPLLLQAWLRTPALLWPLLIIWGGTLYAFYSQGIALLGAAFDESELPTANTVFVMVYCLGGILGPCVGGFAMDAWPRYGLQAVLCAGPFALFVGLVLGLRGTIRR
jgi:MFS family permease